MALTSKLCASLRSRAHDLKPLIHVGKEGVTEAALLAARQAFSTRDLVKVKVLEMAPDGARATGEALAAALGPEAAVVSTMGRTVVLYRPVPDLEGD